MNVCLSYFSPTAAMYVFIVLTIRLCLYLWFYFYGKYETGKAIAVNGWLSLLRVVEKSRKLDGNDVARLLYSRSGKVLLMMRNV